MSSGKVKFYMKEYFTFSAGEKVGILVLLSLILLVITAMWGLSRWTPANTVTETSQFDKEIAAFEKSQDTVKSQVHQSYIPTKEVQKSSVNKVVTTIDLNKADSAELEQLPGIGPVFSKRIIKYRSILGGYYSVNQLNEVYGMKPETVQLIQKFVRVDTSLIQKIDLNEAEFKQINAHPYISFEQTKAICKYRSKKKIVSMKHLEELQIFCTEELTKLKPYLLFK